MLPPDRSRKSRGGWLRTARRGRRQTATAAHLAALQAERRIASRKWRPFRPDWRRASKIGNKRLFAPRFAVRRPFSAYRCCRSQAPPPNGLVARSKTTLEGRRGGAAIFHFLCRTRDKTPTSLLPPEPPEPQ